MKSLLAPALLLSLFSLPLSAQTDPALSPGSTTPSAAGAPASEVVSQTQTRTGTVFAEAKLEARSGSKAAGTVSFAKDKDGLLLSADVTNVSAGAHAIHIHEKGDCSAPDAASAGGHFNPGKQPHAAPGKDKRHAGDFGNIDISKDGKGTLKIAVKNPKDFANWDDIVGKAVIIHAKADDLKTQPTGDAGGRIACGIIAKI